MDISATTAILAVLSGGAVGFILGLLGSGGSILALPLLVYVVGYTGDPHMAIGTTALAVAASAFANMLQHGRKGNVDLRAGLTFALPGIGGALIGARLGLLTPGNKLLFLFAIIMLVVAMNMWRNGKGDVRPPSAKRPEVDRKSVPKLLVAGFLVGTMSGYFGIGGGFLIVPGLVWALETDIRMAIGTSLIAVTAFGLTTASRYGLAGKLDLPIAAVFIVGGILGGILGTIASHNTSHARLRRLFAGVLFLVAAFMLYRNYTAFFPT